MGFSLKKLGSQIFDQVNMFDNNRTYQQRTPTQTKSVFQQAGQAGGQFARGSVGGIAKIANTAAAQAPQVSDTIRQQIAARTNNPNAFRAATERLKATEAKFNRNAGGLLNQGTIWNKDEVQRGDLKTGLRAVPVTAQAMVEGYTLGTGAPVGASIKEFGVKQGLQKSVPALTKTFGGNVAQGGITAYNQGAKGKDILKSAALSGALGTVGDVGLGVVGAAARPILSDAVGKVYGATKANKVPGVAPLKPNQVIRDPAKLNAVNELRYQLTRPDNVNPSAINTNNAALRKIMQDHNIDLVTGTPADRLQRATQFLEQNGEAIQNGTGLGKPKVTLRDRLKMNEIGAVGKNVRQQDPDVTARLWKDYVESKPAIKGDALTGEGVLPPAPALSENAKASLMAKAKAKVGVKSLDEAGGGTVGDSEVLAAIRKLQGREQPSQIGSQPPGAVMGGGTGYDRSNLSLGQKLSPDRIIRDKITHPLEQKIQRGLFNAQTSDIAPVRGFGRLTQGVSKEAGVTDELLAAKRKLHGGIETGKLLREDIADAGAGFDKVSKERVWASLDPEQAAKTGTVQAKLTPEETVYREGLKKQIDAVTQGNLDRGLITPEQAANGDYLKRGYSIFEEGTDNSKAYQQTREALLKQFKGRKDVTGDLLDSAIKDPSYLVAKKTAESNAAWAMVDYGKHLSDTGLTSPVAKPGYVQLPSSKVFGDAAGMYVPKGVAEDFTGFQYNNGILSAFNDMITAYDSLGIRKAKKELLTIFNPAVRAGNQFSNRVVFSNLNGINPIQFEKNMIAAKNAIKTRSTLYREAVSQGLTGLDITQADFAKRIATATGEPNLASKAIEYAKKSYSQADDQARVAAYITHRNRGYPPDEAARLTQRGFQDYKSVGFFYDIAAKIPLIGNAFVRFAGDATRIAKNAALDHPLRTASTIALWATFVNAMSKISGESPEDKKTREDRFGAPKLPFTDISTAVQTPWGEINVSRFLPFYQLNDIQGSVSKLLPLSKSPVSYKDGKVSVDPAGFNDPLLGQFVQLAADKDFRGRSIKDPENTGQFVDPLSSKDQKKNQAGWLATGNLPLGREINSIYSAAKGGEDLYGKKRSLPQATARALGVKVEQFGPEQAKKQRATNTYFEEKQAIDNQIKGLPAKDQEAYKRLTGYYKLRSTTPNEFKPNEDRNVKAPVYEFPEDKWKEYTTSPKLYDLAIEKKYKDAERQGTPIQPEFDKRLSTEFRKQLINNKSLAPGEDVEADARMYDSSEWDTYQKIKKEYTDKASKYYPQKSGEFVDELVKHKAAAFPDKPPAKAAYDAAYAKYANGQGPKPAFNDAVAAAKDKYSEDKRVWTNTERKARGLPPISKEVWDNVTFGFQSDEEKVYKELKYGKGFGGYGSGGNSAIGYAGKSKVSVKGTVAKPKISTKSAGKLQGSVKYAASSKPKVSIRKSLV